IPMAANIDYKTFSVEDFIKDEFFQRWVYFPDAENTAFWENFLTENPDISESIEQARMFLRLLNFSEGDVFQSKIHALKNRIDFAIDRPPSAQPSAENNGRRLVRNNGVAMRVAKIAASVSLIIVASWLVSRYWLTGERQSPTAEMREQSTGNGERTLISLEDGTKIWLNVASTIRYPETFKGKPGREVYLDGEAFFDVTKNKEQPFIVRTQEVQISVLGTSFNVKSYQKDDQIQTALITGKVTIESMEEQPKVVTLAPNQVATYHKDSRKIVLNNETDTHALAGWKDGRLIFDNCPLSEIITALERWYDVNIEVEDENSLKCHFSAKIENLSLKEVLELFKTSDGIDYEIDGRDVSIRGLICTN
ncbi:MAG: DUF4974 domain-containing protein, partial [Bacteroidota bacterium]|nr:DUF4974 domain-containing protein [Bacteroidota bacterium]